MRIEHVRSWPADPSARALLRARWSRLLDHADAGSVFQGFDWHHAWWESFADDDELHLLLVHDDRGELVAIAPLMVVATRRLGFACRRLMFIGTPNHASDYADFIVARGHARARRAILDWITAQRGLWSELRLENVPADSPTLDMLDGDTALRPMVRVCAEAPARLLGDRESDTRALGKKSLRRHVNWFERNGELRYERLSDADAIARHCERFFDQHVQRWEGTGTPSQFRDAAQRAFYRRLALGLREALHFSVVLFDGHPIAYHFGFEHNGVLTWYKPSFDPALERRSPGEVLIRYLLHDAMERGLNELDFTVGSEAFKYRFANVVRNVYRVSAYRRLVERVPARLRDGAKRALLAARSRGFRPSPPGGPSVAGARRARSA